MSVRIAVHIQKGATVLVVSGPVDSLDSVGDTAAPLLRTPGLVVVDLDRLTAVDARRLREMVVRLLDMGGDPERLRLVVRRNSLLELVTRARVHHLVSLHRTVHDAIAVHHASRLAAGARSQMTARPPFGGAWVQGWEPPLRRAPAGRSP